MKSVPMAHGIARQQGGKLSALALGQVTPTPMYTLEATADGPNLRFTINGSEVSTLVDPTLSSTTFLLLGDANFATSTGAVVFRNFAFTPLPSSKSAFPPTTYRAHTPGPNCDTGGAQWALLVPVAASIQCKSAGMQLNARAQSQGELAFTPPGSNFPQNYGVSVQIDLSQMPAGCAGFELRAMGENSYGYGICANGSWEIYLLLGNKVHALASGSNSPATAYTMEAAVNGSNLRLALNGVTVGTASNAILTTTAFLAFGFSNGDRQTGAVVFSNFVFTPLL